MYLPASGIRWCPGGSG